MNRKIAQLAERRAALVAKIEHQRMALALAITPFRGPLNMIDRGLRTVRFLSTHPAVVTGIMALALLLRRKGWLFVLQNGWLLWRLTFAAKHRRED